MGRVGCATTAHRLLAVNPLYEVVVIDKGETTMTILPLTDHDAMQIRILAAGLVAHECDGKVTLRRIDEPDTEGTQE